MTRQIELQTCAEEFVKKVMGIFGQTLEEEVVRKVAHKVLKAIPKKSFEISTEDMEESVRNAKRHVESWPKWKQEAMRREVRIRRGKWG